MSDSGSRLPARPSLEQLQKRAKDLLRRHRAGDSEARARLPQANPKLADAQFAIAREYGFPNWAKLRQHVESLRLPELENYERLAQELAASYSAGNKEGIREINWNHGTSFAWDHDVAEMQRRLKRWCASDRLDPDLALADARKLVAHHYGFKGWEQFLDSVNTPQENPRSAAVFRSTRAPFYEIDWKDNHLTVRAPASTREWELVFDVIREYGITKLTAAGMVDAAMPALARLDQITHLNLEGSRGLTDEGAKHLGGMARLEYLNAGGVTSVLTDRAFETLRHLTELRRFESCWTPHLTDEGAANLAFCAGLESVNMLGTHVGDGLIRALAGKQELRRLSTGDRVTDAGLRLLHEIPAFQAWTGGELSCGLMSFEAGPTHLLVDGPFSDEGLAGLAGLDGLASLSFFCHCSNFTSGGLRALQQMANLGFLGCQGKNCDDEAMRHIACIPRLRMLMGQGTVASDEGFEALSRSQTIEYIWGRECPNLRGRGFAALARMPSLRGLAVSCRNVDDASLSLLPRFPALRDLMPMDVSDDGFRHVGRCEKLEHLWCMYCRDTGDTATENIAGLSRLRSYYAGMTKITDRSLGILSRLAELEKIELWECAGVTDAGVSLLASLPRLREVSLHGLAGVSRDVVPAFPPNVRVRYSG